MQTGIRTVYLCGRNFRIGGWWGIYGLIMFIIEVLMQTAVGQTMLIVIPLLIGLISGTIAAKFFLQR
jgi:hypothetical protein